MFRLFFSALGQLNLQLFLFSMVLFFAGYALAPLVYHKNIRFLTAYPLWIARKIEQWMEKRWNPFLLFLFLFSVNSFSLLINFSSTLVPFLPFIFTLWTGLNVGLVSFHALKGEYYFVSLLNPVALFELPAAFIASTLAFQYNLQILNFHRFDWKVLPFDGYFHLFLLLVIPLLLLAGIIETTIIELTQRMSDKGKP